MVAKNEKPEKPLTHKQEEFCRAILKGSNQSDAYREAYNAGNMLAKTIHERTSVLMRDNKVKPRIAELKAPVVKKVQRSYEKWLAEVEGVAFTPGDTIEVKAPDKLKALELFGKATGYYQDKVVAPGTELEQAATATLVAMLTEVQARIKRDEAIEINKLPEGSPPDL